MRKRAALIRTLVYDPPIILMDEPFGAVDAQTRTQLQEDLLRLWNLGRKTIIFVTHDITEAIALGDRALVLPRAGAHRGGAHDPDPAPAQRQGHLRARRLRRHLRANPGGGAMTEAVDHRRRHCRRRRGAPQMDDLGGRIALALLLLLALGTRRAAARLAVLRPAARRARAHRRAGEERPAVRRHRRDAARVRARLRRRLLLRRAAAVPAAALGARDRGGRALHHGLDGHPEIRAGAVADPVVRHRRHAEARHRHADGVLHRLHHHLRRHPRRRSAARQHGAHRRRQRAQDLARDHVELAAAVLLHRRSRSRCRAR